MIDNLRVVECGADKPVIWRSSCLDTNLGSEELSTFLEEKEIRTVLDLRRPYEYGDDPQRFLNYRRFLQDLGIHYISYQFEDFDDLGVKEWKGYQLVKEHHNLYYECVVWYQFYVFKDLIRLISLYPKSIVIHCSTGRDRTGLIVAILQELVGDGRSKIIEDYMLSSGADRSNLELFYKTCDTKGGIEEFLLESGLNPSELATIRRQLR